jgi:hypothetical protein
MSAQHFVIRNLLSFRDSVLVHCLEEFEKLFMKARKLNTHHILALCLARLSAWFIAKCQHVRWQTAGSEWGGDP